MILLKVKLKRGRIDRVVATVGETRSNISQVWSLIIRGLRFPNSIKLLDRRLFRLQIVKSSVRFKSGGTCIPMRSEIFWGVNLFLSAPFFSCSPTVLISSSMSALITVLSGIVTFVKIDLRITHIAWRVFDLYWCLLETLWHLLYWPSLHISMLCSILKSRDEPSRHFLTWRMQM